jgi:hypothetical protein
MPAVTYAGGDEYNELKNQVEMLQKQLEQVQQALKKYEEKSATKDEVTKAKEEIKQEVTKDVENTISEGMTPDTLVHLAGYADVGYTSAKDEDGSFRIGSFSPIFHYQYRDLFMLEAELEIELESDGETEVALEYLTIDWFMNDYSALVAGKFLSPIGQFRQNLHPSWINKMASAPPGFGHDGAAPISDVGFQVRGGFPLGNVRNNYAVYVSNGPELHAELEDGEFELEGVEAEGFGEDRDGNKVFGGRYGFIPFAGLEIGLSAATGKAAVTNINGEGLDEIGNSRDYDVLGADFAWQHKMFDVRGEFVQTKVGDGPSVAGASDGAEWKTWYLQAAYQFPGLKLEPVLRYADFKSPHPSESVKQWGGGLNYLFAHHLIAKLNYLSNDVDEHSHTPESLWQLQLAYGF